MVFKPCRYTPILLCFLLIRPSGLLSRQSYSYDPVFRWALKHPFAAAKVKRIYKNCTFIYDKKSLIPALDSFSNGGKLDAFRHIFYMAAFAQKISPSKVRSLGKAYEEKNHQSFLSGKESLQNRHDSISMVMDLHNNNLGINLGLQNQTLNFEALKERVLASISAGKALVILRNRKGDYLDCQRHKIKEELYLNNWCIPKCLLPSDLIYRD
ncbi:MAG TPA: hypothetical protein PLQ93_12005 [Bacteroidia bacterium]|nr:hypothetical protein [Bacteroidia bacterium]